MSVFRQKIGVFLVLTPLTVSLTWAGLLPTPTRYMTIDPKTGTSVEKTDQERLAADSQEFISHQLVVLLALYQQLIAVERLLSENTNPSIALAATVLRQTLLDNIQTEMRK